MDGSRGAQVSALVRAMQHGRLSKTELFASLAELKNEASPRPPEETHQDDPKPPPPRVVADLVGAMKEGKLSKSELLSSLAAMRETQKKDKLREAKTETSVSRELRQAEMWAELRSSSVPKPSRTQAPAVPTTVDIERASSENGQRQRPSSSAGRLESHKKQQQQQRKTTPTPRYGSRTQQKPQSSQKKVMSQRRTPQRQQQQQQNTQRYFYDPHNNDEECTFRPRIKELPSSYHTAASARKARTNSNGDFLERVERWQRDREKEMEKRVSREAEEVMGECTFHPRISANSIRAAEMTRANDPRPPEDRLYQEDVRRRAAVEARRSLDSTLAETRFRDEHPFKPQRVARDYGQVEPRYLYGGGSPQSTTTTTTTQRRSRSTEKQQRRSVYNGGTPEAWTGEKEALVEREKFERPPPHCTFTPRVNGVKDDMDLAKTYLATDVFERLTARRSNHVSSGASIASDGNRRGTTKTEWDQFLARQSAFDAKKSRRVQSLTDAAKPDFRPRTRSASPCSKRKHDDTFFDRLAVAQRRRERRELEARPTRDDLECTFHPTVDKTSQRRPRRSVDELSTGDALKRETSRRLLKLKADQDHAHTFKPDLVAKNNNIAVESKL